NSPEQDESGGEEEDVRAPGGGERMDRSTRTDCLAYLEEHQVDHRYGEADSNPEGCPAALRAGGEWRAEEDDHEDGQRQREPLCEVIAELSGISTRAVDGVDEAGELPVPHRVRLGGRGQQLLGCFSQVRDVKRIELDGGFGPAIIDPAKVAVLERPARFGVPVGEVSGAVDPAGLS